ncbi:MAG: GspH/FimT family protein [Pseudomonadota bacterium]
MRRLPCHATASRARSGRGFTLIELLVAIAIVAVLAAVAVPSFQSITLNMRLTSYANELVAASMLARSKAINQNATVTMCQSSDGATCTEDTTWENGYVLTCASNDGVVCTNTPVSGSTDIVLASNAHTANGWKITGSVSKIEFQSTGTGATSSTLTVCRDSPLGNAERIVRISPTGRASVTKTTTGTCG